MDSSRFEEKKFQQLVKIGLLIANKVNLQSKSPFRDFINDFKHRKGKKIFRFVGIYYISKYELKQLFSLIYVSITDWMHSKGYVLWPIIIKKCKYKSIEGHYFMWINLGHYLNNKMFIKCECSKKHQSVTK